jgi:hypothetical protein
MSIANKEIQWIDAGVPEFLVYLLGLCEVPLML